MKKENNEVVEKRELPECASPLRHYAEAVRTTINDHVYPMIYMDDEKALTSDTPYNETIKTIAEFQMNNFESYKTMLDPLFDSDSTALLNKHYVGLTARALSNQIKQETVLSVFSALDNSYIQSTGILNFVYIREMIWDDMLHNMGINQIILDTITKLCSYKVENKLAMANNYAYIKNMSGILSCEIIRTLNNCIEKAVNYVLMRVRMIPNEDKLVTLLEQTFGGLKRTDPNFWLMACSTLKHVLYEDISATYSLIIKRCSDLFAETSHVMAPSIYYDQVAPQLL